MTTEKKARLKKTVTGWLCFAALASGVMVPANLPAAFPSMTAAAEALDPASEKVIDLSKLMDYLNNPETRPAGVSVSQPASFSDIIEVTISNAGTYKLTGKNYINGSYLDVKFIINNVNVTFDCVNVFIKNDRPAKFVPDGQVPDGAYEDREGDVWCSSHTMYNHVVPFVVKGANASLTLNGKLYADTAFGKIGDKSGAAPLCKFIDASDSLGRVPTVDFYINGDGSESDRNYSLQLYGDAYYIEDYIDTDNYPCIKLSNPSDLGKFRFTGHTRVYLRESHTLSEDGTVCTNCGKDFTVNSIAVIQKPKTSYKVGGSFDPTGLQLLLTYADDSTETVAYSAGNMSDFTFTVSEKLTTNDTNVVIAYKGKSTNLPITVTRKTSSGDSSGGSSSRRPSTPIPDPEPQITGKDGKTGWDAVVDEIKDAKDGDSIIINMNGGTLLKGNALSAVAGKNIDLVLDMGNGLTWTIKGDTITNTAGVDLSVRLTSGKNCGIPVEVINLLTGESEYITLQLDHIGDFGFTAILSVNMGSKNKGNYANLYYYRESKGTTEFISAGQIDDKGNAKLAFTHASEYVIMIDDHAHGAVTGDDTPESKPDTSEPTKPDTSDTSSDTSDTSSDTSDTSSDTSDTSSDTSETNSDTSETSSNANNNAGDNGNHNPATGYTIGYGMLLVPSAAVLLSRKKKSKK